MFSYGYDSGVAFCGGTARLTDYARHLLSLLKVNRQSDLVKQEVPRARALAVLAHTHSHLIIGQETQDCLRQSQHGRHRSQTMSLNKRRMCPLYM